jgi:predicted aminopeptidase
MERLPAHVWGRFAGDAECQQHLALERALADGVVAIVGQPDRIVRRHEDAVCTREKSFSERAEEIAVAVEHDHRVFAAIENIDVVVIVYADAADFLKRPVWRQFRPVLHRFVCVCAVANDSHAQNL